MAKSYRVLRAEVALRDAVALSEDRRRRLEKAKHALHTVQAERNLLKRMLAAHGALQSAGAELSNIAFNLAQAEGRALTFSDCRSLREARVAWDFALAKVRRG